MKCVHEKKEEERRRRMEEKKKAKMDEEDRRMEKGMGGKEGKKKKKKIKERFILNLKNYCETAAEGNSKKNIQQLKYSKTQKTNEK